MDFRQFLQRNTVPQGDVLPLVHTTAAYNLESIWGSDTIGTSKCDVFVDEMLNYFFVGRPSYKVRRSEGAASDWQLPCCFIFDYDVVQKPKRIYPFDSGAFAKDRMPDYISMMPLDRFDVASVQGSAQKIIGAYFGDASKYFSLTPKGEEGFLSEFSLGAFDAEAKALHKLYTADKSAKIDDRRGSIEIQSEQAIDLTVNRPIAVICPSIYLDVEEFRNHVINNWKARIISYPLAPLGTDHYYSAIYDRVRALYEELGLL